MADKTINQYPQTSSIGASDLILIGNINTGTLYTVQGSVLNLGVSQSLNSFENEYYQDSSSFGSRINSLSGSLSNFSTGSLVLTSSYYQDSASFNLQIANVYASESNYTHTSSFLSFSASVSSQLTGSFTYTGSLLLTSSFNAFTSSFQTFSASVSSQLTGSVNTGSLLPTASFNGYTASLNTQVSNIYSSQSLYTQLSLFDAYTASLSSTIGSYLLTSSFTAFSASVATEFSNVTGSGNINTGSLLLTSSFNAFSSSYVHDSSSFLTLISEISGSGGGVSVITFNSFTGSINSQVSNVYASESNYLPTSSFNSFSSSYTSFSASVNSRLTGSGGGGTGSTAGVLNFLVGDGQSFTPSASSTVFSSSLIVGHTILQLSQEGTIIAPISRSIGFYTFTSSIGQINLTNYNFIQQAYYQLIYT